MLDAPKDDLSSFRREYFFDAVFTDVVVVDRDDNTELNQCVPLLTETKATFATFGVLCSTQKAEKSQRRRCCRLYRGIKAELIWMKLGRNILGNRNSRTTACRRFRYRSAPDAEGTLSSQENREHWRGVCLEPTL
ncbi:MAG: hypothetical protein V2G34_06555 [bacterium JZ-2024 1]